MELHNKNTYIIFILMKLRKQYIEYRCIRHMIKFPILHFMNMKLAIYIVVALCLVNVATTTIMNPMMLGFAQRRQNQTHNQTTNNNNTPLISLLANNLANRLNKSARILQITSNLPEVKNHAYASFLNQSLHGIPANVDIQKRNVALDILSADKGLGVIFFLMPNGLVYMEEPYSVSTTSPQATLVSETFIKELLAHICQILAMLLFLLLHIVHKPILQFRSTLLKILVGHLFWASGLVV